ncbi:MAG: lipocalin family protein [Flavobacteriales bacterium]|nr:lipocalin family protein [Flavobacteriales bacterium]
MIQNFITFYSLILFSGFSAHNDINKNLLFKKWYLEKYEAFWLDFAPEPHEVNDYLNLKPDFTYESVDEGKFSKGKWTLTQNEKSITLYDSKGESITFNIIVLTEDHLELVAQVDELVNVSIHFSSTKK